LPPSTRSPSNPDMLRAERPVRMFVISLGCPKNLVDTEYILGGIKGRLARISFCNTLEDADIILVNTCAFIEEAVSESIEVILEVGGRKQDGQMLAVSGCLPLRYGREIETLLPEVDLFSYDIDPYRSAMAIAARYQGLEAGTLIQQGLHGPRICTGRPWHQYVKISEGCSNRCTYCLIPRIRGRFRCRPPQEIIEEINRLYSEGAREITLVAQDLTAYSAGGMALPGLLELILRETDIPRLRLMYLYPDGVSGDLLQVMHDTTRICSYMDMPVQHASSRILRAMGRKYSAEKLEETMSSIRKALPGISLRTTVMVGFPGETKEDFAVLKEFVKRWRFHHLGCFAYSDEEDAPSSRLPGKIDPETAARRKAEIMELQAEISTDINASMVGKVLDVLIEGACEETDLLICGRTEFQAPEIDGLTYINDGNDGMAEPGDIAKVKITESHTYDLVGAVLPDR